MTLPQCQLAPIICILISGEFSLCRMSSAGKFQNIVVDNEQAGVNLVCEMNPKSVRKYVHCQHGHVWCDTESWEGGGRGGVSNVGRVAVRS